MVRFAYLGYLVLATAGMLLESIRMRILDHRLVRSLLLTMAVFLAFDAVGVARGWFQVNPELNLWVLPGGISIEEVINLAFLTIFSIALSLGFRRQSRE
jgi:hypothetical protein